MPDPVLYLQAMGAAAAVSVMFLLAVAAVSRPASATRLNAACALAMGFGLAVGYHVLSLRLSWPPVKGLDRFLTIVVPTTLCIELIAGFRAVPRSIAWLLRISLAAAIPRILLHGSTYLSGSENNWTVWQVHTALVVCAALLTGLWILLSWLSQRSPGVSIPLALGLTILCAGLAVMLAGYIKGGAAAFPLAAVLVATMIGAVIVSKRTSVLTIIGTPSILGMGVVGLFGLLFIGRFFGRLSTGCALAMLLAPLVSWATELPLLRNRKPWIVATLRLMLVAVPLLVVLVLAKRDFDRDMAPLL